MDPSASLQLVWASLSPLSSQSVSQGCVHLAQSLRSAFCVAGLCALVSASWTGLGIAGLVWTGFFVPGLSFFFSSCAWRVVWAARLYASPLMAPQSRPCTRWVCLPATWACTLCCKGWVHWLGLLAHAAIGSPACCLGPQSVSCYLAEKCSFLCLLPSKSQHFAAPLWAQLWGSFPVNKNSCLRAPSFGAQAPAQKFSVFSLFMSPSSLLPYFRELSLSPWRPGVFCCHLEVAL